MPPYGPKCVPTGYGPRDINHAVSDTISKTTREKLPPPREPGLPNRDCARGCNNRGQSRPMISAINVTKKTFFERLYLVSGLHKIVPWVKCPYAPTTPTRHYTIIFRFPCNFSPRMASHFLVMTIHQVIWPSPGTLPPPSTPLDTKISRCQQNFFILFSAKIGLFPFV